tara:strand:+ start:251 stop:706 length:456 start_codon:yes stop_codon:yes gene_type:complete
MIEEQKNNPLHGVKLEALLTELVDHYGWEVLASEININCFKSNPSIKSSLKFLRRTAWAREKVEGFFLYKYKRLPKPDDIQYELPPRDRTVPLYQKPGKPMTLKVKTSSKAESGSQGTRNHDKPRSAPDNRRADQAPSGGDVWGNWRNKNK